MTPARYLGTGTDGHAPAYSAICVNVREYLAEKGANRDFSFYYQAGAGMFSFVAVDQRSGAASA